MKTTTLIKHAVASAVLVFATLTLHEAFANPIVEFPLTAGSHPTGIAIGPDGNVWFTEQTGKIGRMHPDGSSTEFLTAGSNLGQIVVGADNNLWFVEVTGNKVGRIQTNGALTEFPTRCQPAGYITSGPHNSVWYPETCVGEEHISEMATLGAAAGTITEHTLGMGSDREPTGIATGSDGNIWFAEYIGKAVARLDVSTNMLTEFSVPRALVNLQTVVKRPGDLIWFVFGETIGRITSGGDVDEFDLPNDGNDINSMTLASDGSFWGSEFSALRRVVVNSSGVVSSSRFQLPLKSGVAYLTPGPGGNLWFADFTGDRIGRIASDAIFFDGLGDTP